MSRSIHRRTLSFATGAALLFFLSSAVAGFDKGNGGDALTCTTATATTVHLLDEIEAEREWSLDLQRQASLDSRLALMADHFPDLAHEMRAEQQWITQNLRFIQNAKLTDLDDDQLYWLPKNCRREQIAIQNAIGVLIDGDLWRQMSQLSKSMLLSHEVLYRVLDRHPRFQAPMGLQSSQPVRFLNALLWSTALEETDLSALQSTFSSLGLDPLLSQTKQVRQTCHSFVSPSDLLAFSPKRRALCFNDGSDNVRE